MDLNQVLDDIATSGFNGVEFMSIPKWFDHLSPDIFSEKELREFINRAGQLNLTIPALCAHCELGKPSGASQLVKRIGLAASLDINLVVTGSGILENEEAERSFHQGLEDAVFCAENLKVTLLLETGGTCHPTGKAVKKITDKFKSDFFKIAYDPGNVALWGKADPLLDLQEVVKDVKHFHVKDHQPGMEFHPPLGKGDIDFNALFSLLKKSNYPGVFSLEVDLMTGGFFSAHENVTESFTYLLQKTNYSRLFQDDKLFE